MNATPIIATTLTGVELKTFWNVSWNSFQRCSLCAEKEVKGYPVGLGYEDTF